MFLLYTVPSLKHFKICDDDKNNLPLISKIVITSRHRISKSLPGEITVFSDDV